MPVFMKYFLQYFWFFSLVTGVLNYYTFKKRMPVTFTDPNEKEEYLRFIKMFCYAITIPFLLLGVLQVLGGFEDPLAIFSTDYNNIYVVLSKAVFIGFWLLMLYWVFFKDGARQIIEHNEIFNGSIPENENLIKGFFLVGCLLNLFIFIFGSHFQ